jgi:hypothetical protein
MFVPQLVEGARVLGLTNLQETMPLVYAMLVIAVIGAAITWSFLVYALWKFRDPNVKGRRYG